MHGITSDLHSISRLHASICWQQSRSVWHKEGDANSKYFHSVLASRRRGNTISSIQVDGVTVEGVDPIRQVVFSHFASHFKARNVERPGVENLQFKRLNWSASDSLIKPFSVDEVKAVVWDCDSNKSPGPDGINLGFFKDFWAELQGDVMRFFFEFHRNGRLTKGLNSTFIALIPKVDNPQRLNEFRPISLVGSIYKILAKVLANRLRVVIGSVISESQTTFMQDRQILDGILIANEVVDEARKTKKELLLFKVDFEKAYDSVEWEYLDAVMGRMYFPTLWKKWMKACVCTATASVLVNGSPINDFLLERGLRQGDPLSPFLFMLAAEGLHVLMKAMVENNLFIGYSVGANDIVSISHLQFADDTLITGVKSWANVRARRAVLVLFELIPEFRENVLKRVSDGVQTFFWTDPWLGGRPLCERFGRLFDLVENKSCTVAEMLSLQIRGIGGWTLTKLWVWKEEMLGECQTLLATFSFQAQSSVTLDAAENLIWHKQVPLKVSICAWRLLRDRLPTKANMQVVVVHGGPFYSSYGLLVCGSCGMREIIVFSGIQYTRYPNC
ncbi:hypothetical protein TSUD_162450 [Trifolium subterraneum]|uniref:Reverse transcriptase domain-containing protein n=1 Tax=Trifolium subterraneum TaxID=3900 RepID=A0A2Z6N0V0_TRISU|nr:hypothetical protein TSUD_162450 [Trifolium subterraneum]